MAPPRQREHGRTLHLTRIVKRPNGQFVAVLGDVGVKIVLGRLGRIKARLRSEPPPTEREVVLEAVRQALLTDPDLADLTVFANREITLTKRVESADGP